MRLHSHSSESSGPMTIGYMIDSFQRGGGTEKQLATLIDGIDRRRFTPILFVLRPKTNEISFHQPCRIEYLNVTRFLSLRALVGLFRLIRLLRKHHVAIFQIFFIDSNLMGVLAARLAGIRRIIVGRRDMGWWYGGHYHSYTNRVNRLVPYCVANSNAVKDAVARHEPFKPERIHVIPNGLDAQADGTAAFPFDRFAIDKNKRLVAIVARLVEIKQIDVFLRIVASMNRNDTQFVIVGHGHLEQQMKELAGSLGLAEKVIFHHTVHGVFDLLSRTDVGVLTSQSEGLSNTLIEYALSGVPSVAFDVGGNREVIKDGITGYLVPPFDGQIMADKISLLLGDDELRTKMGEAACRWVSDEFSVKKMISSTESFYQEIATCG